MAEILSQTAHVIATLLQATAVIIIALGSVETIFRMVIGIFQGSATHGLRRAVWTSFARWLLLGLEFTLAADIVATAINPSWDDIGRLTAIAVIRTFLNYFLERDLERFQKGNT